jgi:hypothetical protein
MVGRLDIIWGDYRQATRFVPKVQALPGATVPLAFTGPLWTGLQMRVSISAIGESHLRE